MHGVIDLVDTVVTAPAQPPLTVEYARRHLRALGHSDDLLVATWILAAAQYFEEQTGRQIITATREVWLDAFPCRPQTDGYQPVRIELPRPPLQTVVSVRYIDGTGDLVSFSDGGSPDLPLFKVNAPAGPHAVRGWLEPVYGAAWPLARGESGAVRIQYTAGYGDDMAAVPELIRGILCYLVTHFDQFRGAVHEARRGQVLELPYGVQAMLDGFKYSAQSSIVLRRGPQGWCR